MDRPNKQEYNVQALDPEAITKQNQETSPLLRLPRELRDCIYAYAFDSATFRFDSATFTRDPQWGPHQYCIDYEGSHLHQVCRQTRSEVHAYRTNIASFQWIVCFRGEKYLKIVNRVGDAQREKLAEIQIHMSSSMAEAFHGEVNGQVYISCRRNLIVNGTLYPALKRTVVTCAGWSTEDEIDIRTSLQGMFRGFAKPGLEVQYKVAKPSD